MSLYSIRRITIHRLAIPLKGQVSHAAADRRVSEPVVVQVELMNGAVGYGETHPREYVTGESTSSVVETIQREFVPRLLPFSPESFFHAVEAVDELPDTGPAGLPISAAKAAIELALLDGYSRAFRKPLIEVGGWLGLRGFGAGGSIQSIRFSGVVAKAGVAECLRQVRRMRFFGLRAFKLKVGYPDDDTRVRTVARALKRVSKRRPDTLRLDANGAWTAMEAAERMNSWADLRLASIEQPLPKGRETELPGLAGRCAIPIMHDESLTSLNDARRLHELGIGGGFNIRLSKCGGFLSSLRIAEFAAKHRYAIQLGCMVGETSILSAAGLRFLEIVSGVKFAEGCFGRFLLTRDVAQPSLRFGYGGRPPRLKGYGWGVNVDASRLEAMALYPPEVIELG